MRFVEAVNFINEQDGLPLAQPELILCLLDHLSDFIGGCAGGRQGHKTSRALLFTGTSDYVCESGLSASRWSPEDEGGYFLGVQK